jgi:hypothetical protein
VRGRVADTGSPRPSFAAAPLGDLSTTRINGGEVGPTHAAASGVRALARVSAYHQGPWTNTCARQIRVRADQLRRRESLIFVALFVVATAMALAVDSPTALFVVGLCSGALFAAIAANVGGFAERAWVSSGWAKRGYSVQLFRIAFGGIGGLIALAEIVAGIALLV